VLAEQSRSARVTVEGLIERWRELGDLLSGRTEGLRDLTESAIARAEVTMQALDRHAEGLGGTADRLESCIDGLREGLREQARDLQAAIDEAAARAQSVAETSRIQERALLDAADEAARKAGEVRQAHLEGNRGVFLHTVNRVLDSLGSLGIDMDRIIEGSLVQDIVRRYGKGDRMVASAGCRSACAIRWR
jgi:ABC-type transporter Mla subunit MlaD